MRSKAGLNPNPDVISEIHEKSLFGSLIKPKQDHSRLCSSAALRIFQPGTHLL